MDDENKKEENQGASTSKKEIKERKDEEQFDDRNKDYRSYTVSTASDFSVRSKMYINKEEPSKGREARVGGGERNTMKRKVVRRGRVTKRRRYQPVRRNARLNPVRRRNRDKRAPERDHSASTILTKLTSISGSPSRSCAYCGHRCCGRRYYISSKKTRKVFLKGIKGNRRVKHRVNGYGKRRKYRTCKRNMLKTEATQVGSEGFMLSPLMISTNVKLADEKPVLQENEYVEITPQMIYDTVECLSRWKQFVPLNNILQHMQLNYPVNSNVEHLIEELASKLQVAVNVEILQEVVRDNNKYYMLCCNLQNRGLQKFHVTVFWNLYADTMSPVKKKQPPNTKPTEESPTQTKSKTLLPEVSLTSVISAFFPKNS